MQKFALNDEEVDLVRAYRRMSTAHRIAAYALFHKICIDKPLPMPELDEKPTLKLVPNQHP